MGKTLREEVWKLGSEGNVSGFDRDCERLELDLGAQLLHHAVWGMPKNDVAVSAFLDMNAKSALRQDIMPERPEVSRVSRPR